MNRTSLALLIPVGAVVATFIIVFGISRILLGVPREVAVPLALFMAMMILGGSAVVASTSKGGPTQTSH